MTSRQVETQLETVSRVLYSFLLDRAANDIDFNNRPR